MPTMFETLAAQFRRKSPPKESKRVDVTAEGTPSAYPSEQPAYHPYPLQGYAAGGGNGVAWDNRQDGLDGIRGRVPRLWNANLGMLAGLTSMDAVHQTAWHAFLPPMEPMQRGGQIRAMNGGKNRVSGSGQQGSSAIPGVFVPVGRR